MLRGLLDLARGAQTAPVPACSCAKGLAVGAECLQSALRGEGFAAAAPAGTGRGSQTRAAPAGSPGFSGGSTGTPGGAGAKTRGSGGSSTPSSGGDGGGEQRLAAAFHSVDLLHSDLPAHDAHALRNILLRSS